MTMSSVNCNCAVDPLNPDLPPCPVHSHHLWEWQPITRDYWCRACRRGASSSESSHLRAPSSTAVPCSTPGDIAEAFHDAYEALAPAFGYRTREASARPWGQVPAANRDLMIATVRAVLFEDGPFRRFAPSPASTAEAPPPLEAFLGTDNVRRDPGLPSPAARTATTGTEECAKRERGALTRIVSLARDHRRPEAQLDRIAEVALRALAAPTPDTGSRDA